jgi:hypothetical protein
MSDSSPESRFERLLDDLEGLVREESVAIEDQDWDHGAAILTRKDTIIRGLLQPGRGIESATDEQRARLQEATHSSQGNANELGRRMAAARRDLAIMGRRKGQAKGVQKAYRIPVDQRPSHGKA